MTLGRHRDCFRQTSAPEWCLSGPGTRVGKGMMLCRGLSRAGRIAVAQDPLGWFPKSEGGPVGQGESCRGGESSLCSTVCSVECFYVKIDL